MKSNEHTEEKLVLTTKNKHFNAGFVSGLGLGLLIAALFLQGVVTSTSEMLLVVTGALFFLGGLLQEARARRQIVRNSREYNLKNSK